MASAAKFPIQPVPEGMHDATCVECNSSWLCDCRRENDHIHWYSLNRELTRCPLCRPGYERRVMLNRDPASEPDDSSDPGVQPEPRGQGLSDWMKRQ